MQAKLVGGGVTLIGADALRDGTMFPYRPPQGDDALTKYRFNDRRIRHLFCAACGVQSFARGTMPDGAEMVAINVRCLNDIDLDALKVQGIDSRNF